MKFGSDVYGALKMNLNFFVDPFYLVPREVKPFTYSKISQNLLDGMELNLEQTFMVPTWFYPNYIGDPLTFPLVPRI